MLIRAAPPLPPEWAGGLRDRMWADAILVLCNTRHNVSLYKRIE